MHDILQYLRSGGILDEALAKIAFTQLLDGDATAAQTGAFLMALSQRGESVSELVSAARILHERATTLHAPTDAIDCCGTGGDQSGSYNISTAVAFVLAACGLPVAKHGNRAASSKSGAADVLETLGVNLSLPPQSCQKALEEIGFCFLMAPQFHSSLKPLAGLRKELGFRTIFNLLGPLANPAGTSHHLLGVFSSEWVKPMAEALCKLGCKSALVVHGSDGLDEITLAGITSCARLIDGQITEYELTHESFGLPTYTPEDVKGGDAQQNAHALTDILNGHKTAYRDYVLANAAAALELRGISPTLKDGVNMAARTLDNGAALHILERYVEFSQRDSQKG